MQKNPITLHKQKHVVEELILSIQKNCFGLFLASKHTNGQC